MLWRTTSDTCDRNSCSSTSIGGTFFSRSLIVFSCCLLLQAANAPGAFARGLLAFEGFILAARECDFWQQIHYLPFLGRLRGGRRGGLLGAAAPPRPPLHSPRTTPPGFPYPIRPQSLICTHSGQSCWAFQVPPACEGCASFAAGASLPSVG